MIEDSYLWLLLFLPMVEAGTFVGYTPPTCPGDDGQLWLHCPERSGLAMVLL